MTVASAMASGPRRAALLPRWVVWLLFAIVPVIGAGIVAAGVGGSHHQVTTVGAEQAALRDYIAALHGPTAFGGQIVEQEMKPSLREAQNGQIDGATLADRARGWQLAMQRVRSDVARIAAPPAVAAVRPLFDQALGQYLAAAGLFERAGQAAPAQRGALLDQAVAAARAADATYDRAAAVLQAALRGLGLPPDAALPDPSPGAGGAPSEP